MLAARQQESNNLLKNSKTSYCGASSDWLTETDLTNYKDDAINGWRVLVEKEGKIRRNRGGSFYE